MSFAALRLTIAFLMQEDSFGPDAVADIISKHFCSQIEDKTATLRFDIIT